MADKRISYISFLQIIGPIFVILGHSLNGLSSSGGWYIFSKQWIYIFHMPLFFLASGYLLSYKGFLHGRSYKEFIFGKFLRLILPYLVWNLAFYVPKLIVQDYISDSAPVGFVDMLTAFVYPRTNIWGHTWFLLGLFVIYAVSPIIERILTIKAIVVKILLVAVCIILYMCPIRTELLAFSDLHKDMLFFVLGCMLGQIPKESFLSAMKKFKFIFLLLGVTQLFHFVPCTMILMSFLSLGCEIKCMPPFWERLAGNSFGIYILHWPVMICVRMIMHQILDLGVAPTAAVMSIMGWVVPVVIVEAIRMLPLGKLKKPLKYLLGV